MAENYVKREEFDALKKEVKEIKDGMTQNAKLLQDIDKKVDIIAEKISSANEIEELKIKPINENIDKLEKKIEKVEGNQTWLWRTIATTIIGIVIKVIFDISKLIS